MAVIECGSDKVEAIRKIVDLIDNYESFMVHWHILDIRILTGEDIKRVVV